jgi:hypothetical protein
MQNRAKWIIAGIVAIAVAAVFLLAFKCCRDNATTSAEQTIVRNDAELKPAKLGEPLTSISQLPINTLTTVPVEAEVGKYRFTATIQPYGFWEGDGQTPSGIAALVEKWNTPQNTQVALPNYAGKSILLHLDSTNGKQIKDWIGGAQHVDIRIKVTGATGTFVIMETKRNAIEAYE